MIRDDNDRTVRVRYEENSAAPAGDLILTVFDGSKPPEVIRLASLNRREIYFGRAAGNDLILTSPMVSGEHGRIRFGRGSWILEDKAVYQESGSTNGLIYNNALIRRRCISEGDFFRIDDGIETVSEGVLMAFSSERSVSRWKSFSAGGRQEITIGRDESCDIVLPHVTTSKLHARIIPEGDRFRLADCNSMNGVIVNGYRIRGSVLLHEKDIITISDTKLIFTSGMIYYYSFRHGISVDANDVVITRGRGRKTFVTGNHVSLNIRPGELVAIIGGSGAGKSTILNCMCGYLPPAEGDVYINGINLYENFDSLKKIIGYVPQSDIVYDNLTLYDMLSYTAKLRLPPDTSEKEREEAIQRAIRLVELEEKTDSFIRSLSGGQKKRASIAVELLSDPNLMFLDEPASGLDPGTERNLMHSLRRMADSGKTVILVTHSTLQLALCDRIVFMGKGGNLCYFGSLQEAQQFFGVSDVVDVYNMITDDALYWSREYRAVEEPAGISENRSEAVTSVRGKKPVQLPVLCARYFKLVMNDRQRLLLLLAQAPLLALLISLVADGKQFEQYEMTKSLLFALSCSAFWVGMLNAIQEVCKERTIVRREYMTGLSMTAYILSKIFVLGFLCVIQSVLIVAVFALRVGLPEEGVLLPPVAELLITTFLTAVSSAAMGLFVSSLFTNADRAMTVAPILLMPQILFSGLIFKLSGATEKISWFAICRWSMEGYGTTANLNSLVMKLQEEGIPVPHEAEDFYEFAASHLMKDWLILILFIVLFLFLARIVLSSIAKDR